MYISYDCTNTLIICSLPTVHSRVCSITRWHCCRCWLHALPFMLLTSPAVFVYVSAIRGLLTWNSVAIESYSIFYFHNVVEFRCYFSFNIFCKPRTQINNTFAFLCRFHCCRCYWWFKYFAFCRLLCISDMWLYHCHSVSFIVFASLFIIHIHRNLSRLFYFNDFELWYHLHSFPRIRQLIPSSFQM